MKSEPEAKEFLGQYADPVFDNSMKLRDVLLANLPGIIEQVDRSAGMVAYCYGPRYSELICVIIPSRNGLKLGFNRGIDLSDPAKLLRGKGKMSRYIEIKSEKDINSPDVKKLLADALQLYKNRQK